MKYNNLREIFLFVFPLLVPLFQFFEFASLVGVSAGIRSSEAGLKICAVTAGIKK